MNFSCWPNLKCQPWIYLGISRNSRENFYVSLVWDLYELILGVMRLMNRDRETSSKPSLKPSSRFSIVTCYSSTGTCAQNWKILPVPFIPEYIPLLCSILLEQVITRTCLHFGLCRMGNLLEECRCFIMPTFVSVRYEKFSSINFVFFPNIWTRILISKFNIVARIWMKEFHSFLELIFC